ncbi:hypothetical protein EXU85_26335 [Spirosoma sp. KCTC 42546]|uniref:sensor histidine kinase n=1 Tax=Spirosoma sp. KCTC 42546 TaxID=2520506 RepID=UPI00115B29A0|nr:ATP-binding protein [Spirosoma sp. KCTC 42546]QDK81937.1 hypothetical protein EXU85_26335 [Spirosoma sp. KCTC 42546]
MRTFNTNYNYPFLSGGGELGELIRTYDWSTSPLGTPDQWPTSLRTLVNMMLTSRFPMLIFWGPELITFYNDAFRPSLGDNGKHPSSLGQRGEQSWAESWPVIGPMIYTIMAGGDAVWFEDQKLPLYRDGQMGYAYWTYSFSPLIGDTDSVNGVLVTCSETTKAVESLQQLNETNAELKQSLEQNIALREEQHASQQQTKESEAKFRTLVEQAPIAACLFIGRELRIEIANQIMLRFWGKDASILGLPLEKALPELKSQPFLKILDDVFTSGTTYEACDTRVELMVDNHLGAYYFDLTYKPLYDADGNVYAIMAMAIDVTKPVQSRITLEENEARLQELSMDLERQVQERTQQLENSVQELKRSNENLQQFAYIASHDLQEPLRKVQQFGDLLKNQYIDTLGDGAIYLERMQSAASRMSTLIRDLLSYSRISTRQDHTTLVSLQQVVTMVLVDLELRIQETGALVEVEGLPEIYGDQAQLEQLFMNLINNALKFHKPKTRPVVTIRVQTLPSVKLPASIKLARPTLAYHRIDIADNGIGFDEKYLNRIFQVFQRLHGKSEFAGTGIGLAICEKVVFNHGGAITARSKSGQGATFSVYLPV